MAGNQTLPPKENGLFKSIVKLYTSKQYKKGIKAADQILSKFPNHGETLAMKGLILNCQEKKTEAYDYVRKGLKNNLASHVCWHTYGLLYRSDRNYLEAIKCYRNALRHDKENMQILRDLSLLQVQMRDLAGYQETRRQILLLKPGQKGGWLTFSIAAHLLGSPKKALGILDSYINSLDNDSRSGFDYSETLLYKNMLLEESGDLEGAVAHLDQVERDVVDSQTLNEQKAGLLHRLGKFEDSERVWRGLVKINPDNQQFHYGLISARLHIDPKTAQTTLVSSTEESVVKNLTELYEELAKEYPRCLAVRRIPLDFLQGEAFQRALEAFIQRDLRRGVPSLFIGLKSLYLNANKRKIIDSVFRAAHESLITKNTFPGSGEKEVPSTHLWARYLLAQHLDRIGDHSAALDHIAQAVEHTPTVIELYTLKAKVLKHAGDIQGAWASYEKAREMDLADRYLNTKATLYALRADKIDTAEKTIALFTSKEGADSQENLFEMQCMWYETECGESFLRQGKHGRALKKLLAVDKHFADITEDQFDFHTYCIRKMTLRTYIKMLRLEDELYGHKFFQKAAQDAVRAYLSVFDTPQETKNTEKEDSFAHLSESERKAKLKRLKQKEEKEKERARLAALEEEKKEAKNKGSASTPAKPADTDPEGKTLVTGDVLAEATKLLVQLHKYQPKNITTNILAFKVHLRRKKYLLAVQALRRASTQDPTHPEVYASILHLALATSNTDNTNTLNETVAKIVKEEVSHFLKSSSPSEFLTTLLTNYSSSLPHLTVAARLAPLVQPEKTKDVVARVIACVDANAKLRNAKEYADIDAMLRDTVDARAAVAAHGTQEDTEKFVQAARACFPLANAFALEIDLTAAPASETPAETPTEN